MDSEAPSTLRFSLVDGGSFCRLLRRFRWVRADGRCNYRRACIVVVAATWGPLLALALIEGLTAGRAGPIDWGIQARLLVTIPLLFAAEASLHIRTQRTINIFASERWAGDQPERLTKIVATAQRLRDGAAPEVILLGCGMGLLGKRRLSPRE
jgi:hypothetical protein